MTRGLSSGASTANSSPTREETAGLTELRLTLDLDR